MTRRGRCRPRRDPREYVQQSKSQAGPTMMFASLVPRNPETGDEWDDESVDKLAAHWSDVRVAL